MQRTLPFCLAHGIVLAVADFDANIAGESASCPRPARAWPASPRCEP